MATRPTAPLHPAVHMHAAEVAAGALSRREFLTRATILGAGAAAYGMVGLPVPARAEAHMAEGGTLRIESTVRALKDPRLYDWPQMSNFTRGWLEYLVEYQRDGAIRGILLEDWAINEDATEYTLNVRPGVTWNDGTPFTAEDVAFNLERWCDGTVEGNSMATRVRSLVDEGTDRMREGAVEVVDDLTLRLRPASPDITLIAGFSDFPAQIVPQDFSGDPLVRPKGTGPYLPDEYEVGLQASLVRNDAHDWWGKGVIGEAALERIVYVDFGEDQASILAAADSDEFDMSYETLGDFVDVFDGLGWERSEAVTANTMVIRANQEAEVDGAKPYADVRVRRALQLAVDNAVVLELGYGDRGVAAADHHVCPIHPEYADIGPSEHDPAAAMALLEEAGFAGHAFELISIDDEWRRNSADAAAAQMRDAGMDVTRTVLPGATFWNDWTKYPLSVTDWAQRPLGVQVLALAYRSGEPWNESAYSNPAFDAALAEATSIADADARRAVMERVETILREDGVIIQPFWRSTYRHAKPGVVGAEQHPAFEIHVYKLGWTA